MTVIRYSLLADERDSSDYIKQCILVAVLSLLISAVFHILGFTIWQYLDKDASDNFHFVIMGEDLPIELVLTFGETQSESASAAPQTPTGNDAANSAQTIKEAGLFSPADSWAESGLSTDFWQDLNTLSNAPLGGLNDLSSPSIQNAIPPSLVDNALALAEVMPPAVENGDDEINPDQPISLEHQAPPYKSYFTLVSRSVNSRWIMPPAAKTEFRPGRLTVLFTIRKNGQLLRLVVQESSGSATLDHAGLEALRSAAPFAPFPPELRHKEQLDIVMHFDYKASYRRQKAKAN